MAVSSKDLETLWQRYKIEAVPAGISVNQFFESNGIPYHVFEKWYKKKYQAPNVVECVIRSLGEDPEDGTAYVFTSKNQKVVKIIRHEHNECQMYYQKFDKNMSFVRLQFEGVLPIYVLEWKYLVAMLSCPVVKTIGPIELKCYEDAA